MDKIVFATNNKHKLDEVSAMLQGKYNVVSLAELNCFDDIPETADTLEGNALLKARYIHKKFGCNCFADDTGLEVEALNGEPGVFSARYAGNSHNARANMDKLLQKMENINNRYAHFRTVLVLILSDKEYIFEGKIEGSISTTPKGVNGFGYDPVFVPKGYSESFAELGTDEKNKISHRALAVKKLVNFLVDKSTF